MIILLVSGCGGGQAPGAAVDSSSNVVNENSQPTISGSPETVALTGEPYFFRPEASDPDDDPLLFVIRNKPQWAEFDSADGTLSGTPAESDLGVTRGITISVQDQMATVELPAFDIQVERANSPPEIRGEPSTVVRVGDSYYFAPEGSDPDGDSLTFEVENLPSWAVFNGKTGSLSGTPESSDVGTHLSVIVSVSDGEFQTQLAAFDITVVDHGTGTALLVWTPPDSNVDDSPLTDLAGYKVYSGLAPDALAELVRLDFPGISDYTVTGLAPGTYYFAVSAYDGGGNESELSEVVSKQVP